MATQTHYTLFNAIKEDHDEMYSYFDKYTEHANDAAARERWANLLTWEIARHAVGEEIVVYPLMEKHLGPEGKQMADRDRQDHQYVKESLYKLEKLKPGAAEHAAVLKDVMDHLRKHNNDEETIDLPRLESVIGAEGSKQAANSFKRTKQFAPTRPHPSAPDKPPFETLAGFLAAPMDKLKDLFASFPSAEEKAAARENLN